MDTSSKRLPNVGEFLRNVGTLVKVEDVVPNPPPITKEYIFEEITARIEIRFKDELMKYLGTLNDFYGLGTSVNTAIEDAKNYAKSYKITPTSELEVVVVKIVSQTRMKPTNRENSANPNFYDFEYLDFGRLRDLPEPTETVVWSSKNGI